MFLAPSISLLSQTIREWLIDSSCEIGCIPVCSDGSVGRRENEDYLNNSLAELVFPASTNPEKFAENYNNFKNLPIRAVFSTYQSIDVVKQGQDICGFEFDLIICDEAHRTTGATLSGGNESSFVKIHDAGFIKGRKRLYMTATPKIYGDAAKRKAADNNAVLCSMDDESLYGKEFYRLSFGEAVEKDLLTDYKVVIFTVPESEANDMRQAVADGGGDGGRDMDDYGKIKGAWYALSKRNLTDETGFIEKSDPLPMKRAVAFTGTIAGSKFFAETVNRLQNEYDCKNENLIPLECGHIDGGMAGFERSRKLAELKKGGGDVCRILSNARCLSEGVDVPSLDAVIFLSPKNSKIDVIQAVGRVMRKSEGKKYGYIILPVIVPERAPEESLNDNKKYKVVWDVLQALRSHDDRFNIEINKLEFNKSCPKIITGGLLAKPEELNLEIGYHEWKEKFRLKIINKCGDRYYWETWAKDVADIAKSHILIIKEILSSSDSARVAFGSFLKNLRDNLNEDVDENGAIEMIGQHFITKPVFDALFSEFPFVKSNPVSVAMQEITNALDDGRLTMGVKKLEKFYESVKKRVEGISTAEGKQKVIIELYDKFFRIAFKSVTEKLGIVYTPVEPVDFMIRSVEHVLNEKFNRSLTSESVHIIDPFTGTGTFVTRLLRSGFIKPENLEYKYKNEIHANEIILLAYYIAAVNIEETYHDITGKDEYSPFEGIVFTDTFNLDTGNTAEKHLGYLEENYSRRSKQQKAPIKVIIGNPPYSVGQKSENDNNKNAKYPALEKRIKETYAKYSTAQLKNSLYDSYIKAFRWASDRMDGGEGVICFITNGGYIDGKSLDGFRKCLADGFSDIYCFNLRGNQRTQGELSRREGGKIFGSGCRAAIAITLLVKEAGRGGSANIHYYDIGDGLKTKEKLEIIKKSRIDEINWKNIIPDKNNDWINNRNDDFNYFMILGDKDKNNQVKIFNIHSCGIATKRAEWLYNFDGQSLKRNITNLIDNYNDELRRYCGGVINKDEITNDTKKIKWSDALKKYFFRKKYIVYQPEKIITSFYKPFCKQRLYYGKELIDRTSQMMQLYPTAGHKNLLICISGVGSKVDFMPLMVNCMVDSGFNSVTQCFPLYKYTKYDTANPVERLNDDGVDEYGYKREYAVSGCALREYRGRYGENVSEEDIFYYVYGLLHNEEYRLKYANDLKKSLPRVPFVKTAADFELYGKAGRELAALHINYETLEPYDVAEEIKPGADYKVRKIKFGGRDDKSAIIFNEYITFKNIPLEAYEYKVNGKSPVEWVLYAYEAGTDKYSGIQNDPNMWSSDEKYIYNLIKRLITLSLETLKIIKRLPPLDIEK